MKIKLLVFALTVCAVVWFSYRAGVNATRAQYEQTLHSQKVAFDSERQALNQRLTQIKQTAAHQAAKVEKHFIPVERKVIEYVSKPQTDRNNQCDFTEWMRLHNRAAEGTD